VTTSMFGVKRGAARCTRFPGVIGLALLFLIHPTPSSLAAGATPLAERTSLPVSATPAPPDFMRNKPRIPDLTLKDKKEGWYFTGIPLIGVDPDTGVNYGASIQWFENGPKDSPFFSYAPYRKRAEVIILRTTEDTQEYTIEYDQPYIADSPWRVRAFGGYLGNEVQGYYGVGERTLGRLNFPGRPGTTYRRANDYFDALKENPDGKTWARFNAYDKRQVLFKADLERDYLGGLLRPLAGLQISHVEAVDYSGDEVKGAVNQETLLRQDHREGRIRGFGGGWLNLLRLGLTYDSRDYEPNPTSGILGQLLFEGTARWAGAGSDYGHLTAGWQGYQRLFPELTKLVLAANAAYSVHFGEVPFYAYPSMSVPTGTQKEGLGGWSTLRGYHANRFIGKVKIQGNLELRWSLPDFTVWNQHFQPMLAPFVDTGRVFDKVGRFSASDWKTSGGVSVRLAWNLATIISFDYGFGSEGNLAYLWLGQPF